MATVECAVQKLESGDIFMDGIFEWMVHSVDFLECHQGHPTSIRIRLGNPDADDTGSMVFPTGHHVKKFVREY